MRNIFQREQSYLPFFSVDFLVKICLHFGIPKTKYSGFQKWGKNRFPPHFHTVLPFNFPPFCRIYPFPNSAWPSEVQSWVLKEAKAQNHRFSKMEMGWRWPSQSYPSFSQFSFFSSPNFFFPCFPFPDKSAKIPWWKGGGGGMPLLFSPGTVTCKLSLLIDSLRNTGQ